MRASDGPHSPTACRLSVLVAQIECSTGTGRVWTGPASTALGTRSIPTGGNAVMATIKSEQQLQDVLQQRRPRAVITSGSFEVSIARSSRQARARIALGGVAVLKLSGESDLTVTDRAVLCFRGDCTVECSNETTVVAHDGGTVYASGESSVHVLAGGVVNAAEHATVFVYGTATIYGADHVRVVLLSESADIALDDGCVLDVIPAADRTAVRDQLPC